MASELEARIIGVMAASGSGKGVWLKELIRTENPERLVIWDFKNEYQEFTGERAKTKCKNTLAHVQRAMVKAGDGPLRTRYAPRTMAGGEKAMRREFEALCSLVQAWENCWFLVEELSNVTMPSWAPPAWRMMTTGGRHEGITIIGVSQSPALIDKTFLSNCTLIHVGQLHEHAHRNAVEKSMDLLPGELSDLLKFQWVEKHRTTGEYTTGAVSIKGKVMAPIPRLPTPRRRGVAPAGQDQAPPVTLGPQTRAGGRSQKPPSNRKPT
jgi:hypothetical protein